ncbi:hypothetical protein [uncultured Friedmanniella sp.]|uniref:hypothetical protein n=1 Tax=uncultured Friedmanniella sp. TaxID=335381 RepID=UPI0035CBC170
MTNSYALGELSRAFLTATTHEDPDVRRRADRRAHQWAQAIEQMANGRIAVGSRSPARGLPPWVTLDVLRGGFARGSASAETPIGADEIALASRLGIPAERRLVLGYFVTDPGLQELYALLDSGAYRVDIPEDAILLTMAWLVRAGDREAALDLLDAVSPFADRFRLAPKVATVPTAPPEVVYRITAGDAAAVLRSRKPNAQVEAQREALAIWNPFGDRVLTLWLEKYVDGLVTLDDDHGWRGRASALVEEYDRLASVHTRCTKHQRPKENLAILVRTLRTLTSSGDLQPREAGLVRVAIEASLAKRGTPGSAEHVELRQRQRSVASTPAHARVAAVAAERLRMLDQADGIEDPGSLSGRVTQEEAAGTGVVEGSTMPHIVSRILARAHFAPIETLLAEGVVPSAEVLAELLPRISATVVAAGFADPALARLAAANYRAFRRRRSLLLLDLAKQVQLTELPWVRAVAPYSSVTTEEATAVARRVGALALDHFPATILPNPLVAELDHLFRAAGHDVPLVEELAADIFMGRFSDKFRLAAQTAIRVVGDTVYTRYFGIEARAVLSLVDPPSKLSPRGWIWRRARESNRGWSFADLCRARAGRPAVDGWSVAANGMVIEQSQILTTHNLAALVTLGVRPTRPWVDLARDSIEQTAALLDRATRQPRPLATVKDAAYAWRQAVFYLSQADPAETGALIADPTVAADGPAVMAELLSGLRVAAAGSRAPQSTRAPFVGWTVGRHWVLDAIGHSAHTPS